MKHIHMHKHCINESFYNFENLLRMLRKCCFDFIDLQIAMNFMTFSLWIISRIANISKLTFSLNLKPEENIESNMDPLRLKRGIRSSKQKHLSSVAIWKPNLWRRWARYLEIRIIVNNACMYFLEFKENLNIAKI